MQRSSKIKHFIIDVDGVMTTGQFIYTVDGKVAKIFGPHDSDGLKLISGMVDVQFITADVRGFEISKKRIVDDLGYPLTLVTEAERFSYIEDLGFQHVAFMADGYHDAPILKRCEISIVPASARVEACRSAKYVTRSRAAEGAVLDACLYLKDVLTERYSSHAA